MKNLFCHIAACVANIKSKRNASAKSASLQAVSDDDLMSELIRRDITHRYLEKAGFLAWKLWSREDIESVLASDGYAVTDENVDEVINTGMLKGLEDIDDGEWEVIHYAIHQCAPRLQPGPVLPTRVVFPDMSIEGDLDEIADALSDRYGYLVKDFRCTVNENLNLEVYDIEWDTTA